MLFAARRFLTVCVVFGSCALANLALAGPLPTDPAAIPAWQGSTTFSATTMVSMRVLEAEVEYAVYAPGQFSASTALGNPALPAGAVNHYVYAYQLFNNPNGAADIDVTELSVGFQDLIDLANDAELPGNASYLPGFGSLLFAPGVSLGPPGDPTSVLWSWDPPIDDVAMDFSTVLYYTSPFGPEWDTATVKGTIAANTQPLPSPLPEPSSIVLALFGVMALVFGYRRRRGILRA